MGSLQLVVMFYSFCCCRCSYIFLSPAFCYKTLTMHLKKVCHTSSYSGSKWPKLMVAWVSPFFQSGESYVSMTFTVAPTVFTLKYVLHTALKMETEPSTSQEKNSKQKTLASNTSHLLCLNEMSVWIGLFCHYSIFKAGCSF